MKYKQLLNELNVKEEVVMEFFVVFSRFEFALKKAGYLKTGRNESALPDWNDFAIKNEDKFDMEKDARLSEAWNYLDKEPPQMQIVNNGKLDFKIDERLNDKSSLYKAALAIKTVRNNLFHGGKFPRSGIVDDPARKTELLKKCVILLEEMLDLDPDVKKEFFSAGNGMLFTEYQYVNN